MGKTKRAGIYLGGLVAKSDVERQRERRERRKARGETQVSLYLSRQNAARNRSPQRDVWPTEGGRNQRGCPSLENAKAPGTPDRL